MKRAFLYLFFLGLALAVEGQVPDSFPFRTSIRNAKGEILNGKNITLEISILKGSLGGEVVFKETHNTSTDAEGMVSITIGEGKAMTGDISTISWNSDNYFLKVSTDAGGEKAYSDILVIQLLVVPSDEQESDTRLAAPIVIEDELIITRKFAGSFIDYRHTGSDTNNGPNLIWIKTSLEGIYGKFSAYGKKCDFRVGENLYLKRTFFTPGQGAGFWIYQIENDSSQVYRLSDLQHDKKVLVESWF